MNPIQNKNKELVLEEGSQGAMLVFDACALIHLSAPVSAASTKDDDTGRYLEILYKLAALPNIDRIVIPDIIVWEAIGQVDGKQLDESFADTNSQKNKGYEIIKRLIDSASVRDVDGRIIYEGEVPKIEIRNTNHPIMDRLRNWDADHNNQYTLDFEDRVSAQGAFSKADFGERITKEYLTEYMNYEGDVFFVSDDGEALTSMVSAKTKSEKSISVVSSLGLINAAINSVIGDSLGIENSHNILTIRSDLTQYNKNPSFGSQPLYDYEGKRGDGSIGQTFHGLMQGLIFKEEKEEEEEAQAKPVKKKARQKRAEVIKEKVMNGKQTEIAKEMALGFLIRDRRVELSLSQAELAEKVREELKASVSDEVLEEITQSLVREWELVRSLPNEEQFEALQKVLIDQDKSLSTEEIKSLRAQFVAEFSKIKATKSPTVGDVEKLQDLIDSRKESLAINRKELTAKINDEILRSKKESIEAEIDKIDGVFVSNLESTFGLEEKPADNVINGFVNALEDRKNGKKYAAAYADLPEKPVSFLQNLLAGKPQASEIVVKEIIDERQPEKQSLSDQFNALRGKLHSLLTNATNLPTIEHVANASNLSTGTLTPLLSTASKPYLNGKLALLTDRTEIKLGDALKSAYSEPETSQKVGVLKELCAEYRELAAKIEKRGEKITPMSRGEKGSSLGDVSEASAAKPARAKPTNVIGAEIWNLFTEQDGERMTQVRISDLSRGDLDSQTLSGTLGNSKAARLEIDDEVAATLRIALRRSHGGENKLDQLEGLIQDYNKSWANEVNSHDISRTG